MRISKNSEQVQGSQNRIRRGDASKKSTIAEALNHVKCAIDLLGPSAKTNPVAREALINLGVIAVDLNSNSPRR